MDKFEETMQMMSTMTEDQKMKAIGELKPLCICGRCPSYNDCAKEKRELLYCSVGASQTCIKEAEVCICGSCPVTPKMGLKNQYFCTHGSEKELRGL